MLAHRRLALTFLGLGFAGSVQGADPATAPAAAAATAANASAPPSAPAAPPAPAVVLTPAQQAAIDALKLYPGVEPRMSSDGSAAYLVFATTNGRTQLVTASAATFGFPGFPQRSLSSVAVAKLPAPLDPALLLRLLSVNSLGYWRVGSNSAGLYLYFEIDAATSAAPDYLRAALNSVAMAADALEMELTKKDDH